MNFNFIATNKNNLLAITAVTIILFIILNKYIEDSTTRYVPPEQKYESKTNDLTTSTKEQKQNNSSIKYILHYNDFFGMTLCMGDYHFQHCQISSCVSTEDHSLMPVEQLDAIIFNDPAFAENKSIPTNRSTFQKYVFLSWESPITFAISRREHFYNWTLTYRKDADLYRPFGETIRRKNDININPDEIQNKPKLIAWVVSNCHTKGVKYRMNYVKELQHYIPVDIYGKCGNLSCPGRMSRDCYSILDKNYKFYLAFENSLCKEYITEKLFNILKYTNLVPVVLGFADYKSVAPPNSYINVENFESPKELAHYLYNLSSDINGHMKYLEWKSEYDIKLGGLDMLCCDLCRKLHEPLEYSSYANMTKWVWGENSTNCKIVS